MRVHVTIRGNLEQHVENKAKNTGMPIAQTVLELTQLGYTASLFLSQGLPIAMDIGASQAKEITNLGGTTRNEKNEAAKKNKTYIEFNKKEADVLLNALTRYIKKEYEYKSENPLELDRKITKKIDATENLLRKLRLVLEKR